MTHWHLSLFSLWFGPVHSFSTVFIHQYSYFLSLTWAMVGHFSALLLLSVLSHCKHSLGFKVTDQVRSGTAPAWGTTTAQYTLREGGGLHAAHAREWLTLLRHSPWLWLVVLIQEQWILANQITAPGWTHRQLIFTQLICISFYCQIMMTILANTTKNIYRLQPLSLSMRVRAAWAEQYKWAVLLQHDIAC